MSITGKHGFTLVEVLLAIGIAAILAICLYNIYFNGLRFDRTADRLEKYNNEVRWISGTIASDLENMVSFTMPVGKAPIFSCEGDQLQFVRVTGRGLSVVAPFIGEDAFLPHLLRLLRESEIPVELHFARPLRGGLGARRSLAKLSREQVESALAGRTLKEASI